MSASAESEGSQVGCEAATVGASAGALEELGASSKSFHNGVLPMQTFLFVCGSPNLFCLCHERLWTTKQRTRTNNKQDGRHRFVNGLMWSCEWSYVELKLSHCSCVS